jgi:TatD DNase family protein
MLADSHAHLDMPQFDEDREAVLDRARAAGVGLVVSIASASPADDSVERTLRLAESHEDVRAGIGMHPHDARLADARFWERMREWARHPRVVLWGEIGLDYYYDHSPRAAQQEVFRLQLELAREAGLPVSIHCRDAWDDLVPILTEAAGAGPLRGILHSFTGNADQARACVELGFLISFSGIVTFKNAAALREALTAIGVDPILVETDSPFLAPVPHRGTRNEPARVVVGARSVAATLGVSYEAVALATSRNLRALLGLQAVEP